MRHGQTVFGRPVRSRYSAPCPTTAATTGPSARQYVPAIPLLSQGPVPARGPPALHRHTGLCCESLPETTPRRSPPASSAKSWKFNWPPSTTGLLLSRALLEVRFGRSEKAAPKRRETPQAKRDRSRPLANAFGSGNPRVDRRAVGSGEAGAVDRQLAPDSLIDLSVIDATSLKRLLRVFANGFV